MGSHVVKPSQVGSSVTRGRLGSRLVWLGAGQWALPFVSHGFPSLASR